jgi:hypothetical protein
LGVEAVRLLRPDGEVADQDVRSGLLEDRDDVRLRLVRLDDRVPVVRAQPVQGAASQHRDAGGGHVGEADRVVGFREDRFGNVLADLLGVDVERRDDADVADVVPAELDVHQAGHAHGRVGVLVVLEPLDQG